MKEISILSQLDAHLLFSVPISGLFSAACVAG